MLTLDPCAIIVSMKTGLRVYSTRGTMELRSKNLARVHEILQKRLTGQYTENALVSAVPLAQRMTVRKYLRALRDAGAIQPSKSNAAQYFRRRMDNAVKSRFAEAGYENQRPGSKQTSLQYVTRREFSSLLVQKAETRAAVKRQLYVLMDESWNAKSGTGALDRQAFYSRWLLSAELPRPGKSKIEVFQIGKNAGELSRMAELAGKSLAINRKVPKALELVHATDIEQAPLAVCQANSTFCSMEKRLFGMDYDRVAEALLRGMLVHMTCESADAFRQIQWRRISIAKGIVSAATLLPVVRVEDCVVAASLGELQLRLLERLMSGTQRTIVHTERCDLLQSWNSLHLDYLAQVLRQRHSCLEAQAAVSVDGLYQFAHGNLRTASFLRHRALRNLMILLVWKTYYAHCDDAAHSSAHECDDSLMANPLQGKRILRRAIQRLGAEIDEKYVIFAKISCWGKSAWVGMIDG